MERSCQNDKNNLSWLQKYTSVKKEQNKERKNGQLIIIDATNDRYKQPDQAKRSRIKLTGVIWQLMSTPAGM